MIEMLDLLAVVLSLALFNNETSRFGIGVGRALQNVYLAMGQKENRPFDSKWFLGIPNPSITKKDNIVLLNMARRIRYGESWRGFRAGTNLEARRNTITLIEYTNLALHLLSLYRAETYYAPNDTPTALALQAAFEEIRIVLRFAQREELAWRAEDHNGSKRRCSPGWGCRCYSHPALFFWAPRLGGLGKITEEDEEVLCDIARRLRYGERSLISPS